MSIDEELGKLRAELLREKTLLSALEEEHAELKLRHADLETQLGGAMIEMDDAAKKHEKIRDSLRKNLSDATNKLRDVRIKNERLRSEVRMAKAENEAFRAQMETWASKELLQQAQAADEERDAARECMQVEAHALQRNFGKVMAEHDELAQQLQASDEELAGARLALEEANETIARLKVYAPGGLLNQTPMFDEGWNEAVEECGRWLHRQSEAYPLGVFPTHAGAMMARHICQEWPHFMSEEVKRE